MKLVKKFSMSFLYIISIILILTIITSTLNYFNIINDKVFSIIKIFIIIISFIIGGIYVGKHSSKKGFIEGLKLGIISSIIFIIFNYLAFSFEFEFKDILFYIVIITSSILGSMIGINLKKDN